MEGAGDGGGVKSDGEREGERKEGEITEQYTLDP